MYYSSFKSLLPFCFSVLLFILSCSQGEMITSRSPESYFEEGKKYFEKEKWDKAIEAFNLVVLNNPGGELADDAQYYLGESHFNKKEYIIAISEFEQLSRRYQYSEFYDDARFKIAECYYNLAPKYYHDQQYTYKALDSFQEFIEDFPESEFREKADKRFTELRYRLAKKLFETARLYKKLRAWDSAIIYYDALLEKYYDLPISDTARIEKAYCLVQMQKYAEARNLVADLQRQTLPDGDKKRLDKVITILNTEVNATP